MLAALVGVAFLLDQRPAPETVAASAAPGLLEGGTIGLPEGAEVDYESSRMVVAHLLGQSASEVREAVQDALEAAGTHVTSLPSAFLEEDSRVLRWDGETCGVVDLRPRDGYWEAVYSRSPECV